MKIVIYGAIANPQIQPSKKTISEWKTNIKQAVDRLLWSFKSTKRLDFRNYDAPYETNSGDIAIADSVRNQIRSIIKDVDFVNVNWGKWNTLEKSEIDKCSLIVIAGSGYFFLTQQGFPDRIVRDLEIFEKTSIPVAIYGAGLNLNFGYLENNKISITENDAKFLSRYLSRITHIAVRDRTSQYFLSSHTNKTVALIGDPALFLNPGHPIPLAKPVEKQSPRIGVNFPFHGRIPSQLLKKNLPAYAKMLRTLQSETGGTLHYFEHSHSEWVIPVLLRDSGLAIETVRGDPEYLSSRYAEMTVHLGGMLHSCILAVGAGTPCVLLPYDIKHRGFAELVGLEAHCHDATDFDSAVVLNSLRYLLANEMVVRANLRQRLDILYREQDQFLRECLTAT
jgi:polysaccharide pyruvyl transferase WcaK-like protein